MKKAIIITALLLIINTAAFPQSKDFNPLKNLQAGIGTQISPSYLAGLLPVNNFQMHHSLSAAVVTGGGSSVITNSYVNTMTFDFSFPLKVRLDLGLMTIPYYSGNYMTEPGKQFFGNLSMQYQLTPNSYIGLSVSKGPIYYHPTGMSSYNGIPDYFNDN